MTENRLLGVTRELMTAMGAGLAAWGLHDSTAVAVWPEATGLVLALVSLVWGWRANAAPQKLFTVARKVLSAAGGVAVGVGFFSEAQVGAVIGVLATGLAMAWSAFGKGDPDNPGNPYFFVPLLLVLSCFFVGCAGLRLLPVDEDGCQLIAVEKDGRTYAAGPCYDQVGQHDATRVQWENQSGQRVRATRGSGPANDGEWWVEYFVPDETGTGGAWIGWSSKSGVMLGPVPPVLEGDL